MNNNNIDQINMRSSKRKSERFNHKHGVNTSMGIGEMQCFMCKEVVAGSKTTWKVGNVVRLAPMVAPTFGQLKLHHHFGFVGMSDLSDKFAAFLAEQPVAFGDGLVQVPKTLPQISRQLLTAFALVGAKCNIYRITDNGTDVGNGSVFTDYTAEWSGIDNPNVNYPVMRFRGDSDNKTAAAKLWDAVQHGSGLEPSDPDIDNHEFFGLMPQNNVGYWQTGFKNYTGFAINLARLLGLNLDFWIPSANWGMHSFFTIDTTNTDVKDSGKWQDFRLNIENVTPETADMIVIQKMSYADTSDFRYVAFCFKLSDFGRRWKKLLLSLGLGFDICDTTPVSLMKLFAVYKSYFDMFGLTLYQGWETTNCARVISAYDSNYFYDYKTLFETADTNPPNSLSVIRRQNLVAFFSDLADMWYTEEQDWVTAHMRTNAVSPETGVVSWMEQNGTPTASGNIPITEQIGEFEPQVTSINGNLASDRISANKHAYINNVIHSQLDAETLQRLYKVTNRNTIAGRRIAELLKAQGLGEYMKKCKTNFCGHASVDVEIFDVTATADAFDAQGIRKTLLGEYVGKGVGEGTSRTFSVKAPEVGFIIDLSAIVPESGWLNGEDLDNRNLRKLDFYNPEYDGLGMEISPKSIVCSDRSWMSLVQPDCVAKMGFGFIPRYTRHKVIQNIANGDINLRSTRAAYLPYILDKFVDLGERAVTLHKQSIGNSSGNGERYVYKMLEASKLPLASPMYRKLGRYPWMGRFNRIFANEASDASVQQSPYYNGYSALEGESVEYWFNFRSTDNFIVHNIFLQDYYAPMLAIEDSFETHDDGNNGVTDMSIGKA